MYIYKCSLNLFHSDGLHVQSGNKIFKRPSFQVIDVHEMKKKSNCFMIPKKPAIVWLILRFPPKPLLSDFLVCSLRIIRLKRVLDFRRRKCAKRLSWQEALLEYVHIKINVSRSTLLIVLYVTPNTQSTWKSSSYYNYTKINQFVSIKPTISSTSPTPVLINVYSQFLSTFLSSLLYSLTASLPPDSSHSRQKRR